MSYNCRKDDEGGSRLPSCVDWDGESVPMIPLRPAIARCEPKLHKDANKDKLSKDGDAADDICLSKIFGTLNLNDSANTTRSNNPESNKNWVHNSANVTNERCSPVLFDEDTKDWIYDTFFYCDVDGDTCLHSAMVHRDFELATQIIEVCPEKEWLDIPNNRWKQTPLHLAVHLQQPTLVRKLISAGARVDCQDHGGNTPAHLACKAGDLDCVRQLVTPVTVCSTTSTTHELTHEQIKHSLELTNFYGDTCLHLALANGHLSVVKFLLQSDLDLNVNIGDGRSGRTVLHHAVESGNVIAVQLLLMLCAKTLAVDATTFEGFTPVELAYGRNQESIFLLLVQHGADVGHLYFEDLQAFEDIDGSWQPDPMDLNSF